MNAEEPAAPPIAIPERVRTATILISRVWSALRSTRSVRRHVTYGATGEVLAGGGQTPPSLRCPPLVEILGVPLKVPLGVIFRPESTRTRSGLPSRPSNRNLL